MKRIIFLIILSTFNLSADTASPSSFIVYQPNGDSLKINIRGNYLQAWHEYRGSTITKNDNKWWVYASNNIGKKLESSSYRVGIEENPFSDRNIRPEKHILIDSSPIPNLRSTRSDTFHIPWILVDFPDASSTYDSSQFELI